ncbi:hypothetical protein ACTHQ6_19495, partial [Arthrobacter sp. SAFR-179]|uniref:hypothetical protein n=1 Tax=Arthrobacter sp. SAFR-179 TaxID=3387279 RepID=UPI003F7BD0E8
MVRGAVQFLARDVLVNLGRAFPVRTVGAAKVSGVGHAGRALLLAVASKATGAGSAAAGFATCVTAVEAARCPVLPVSERLAVLAAETAAVTLAITARTVAKRLTVTIAATKTTTITLTVTAGAVTKRLPVTVTKRLPLAATGSATITTTVTLAITAGTITKRLTVTIAAAKTTAVTLTVTAGTVTKRLTVTITAAETTPVALTIAARTITKRLAVTITERLPLTPTGAAAKTTPITFAIATGAITKRLAVTVTVRLPLTATGSATKTTTITFAIAARPITKRLAIAVTIRLPFTITGRTTTGGVVAVAVGPGPESAGIPTGVVVAAERATVVAAVAPVVLGHMDSSCCEPTTGATAAARFVSYATRNQALRSPYIFINSSGATKSRWTVGALAAVSWPSSQRRPPTFDGYSRDAPSHLAGFPGTPAHILRVFLGRPLTSCWFSWDARRLSSCVESLGRLFGCFRCGEVDSG